MTTKTINILVRCNPAAKPFPTTFFDKISGANVDEIWISGATNIVFTPDVRNSDPAVHDFKIDMSAFPPSDISVSGRKSATMTVADSFNKHVDAGLYVGAYVGDDVYISGGKPVIRNEPSKFIGEVFLERVIHGVILGLFAALTFAFLAYANILRF